MCDRLYEGERVEESFKDSTFAREKMAFTSFSYGYAIPHALNYSAIRSTMGIAILKKPVQWGEYQVRLVLAVRDDERELLKIFFDWLGNLSDDTLLLSKIMKAKTASEFVGLIE
jgi:lichenan operon transcriptional antiterminator